MQVTITQAIKDCLARVQDVPDVLQRRFDAIAPAADGAFTLTLNDDEAMALTELVQWHIRSDERGQPTPETAPFAELIRRVDDAQFG